MRDLLRLQTLQADRLAVAVDQLLHGLGFVYDDVWFLREKGQLKCQAVVDSTRGELSLSEAEGAVLRARAALDKLAAGSEAFRQATASLEPALFVIEDYGMGTLTLCELKGDQLVWRNKKIGHI